MLDVMDNRRKHKAESGAGESFYVHSEQRRNLQSKAFHESTVLTLLPPRPRSYRDAGLYSRGSETLGLQVQGFCCPLQQRPCTGRVTHRLTPQSREGGDGSLTLLSSLKGRLESRAKPASRSRTGSRAEMIPEGGATVYHHRAPVTAETPTTPCVEERRARHGHPGAAKVSELHLYLPSLLASDDDEQDADTEEMSAPCRTSAEETSAQESEVKANNANPLVFPKPSHISQDQPDAAHLLC